MENSAPRAEGHSESSFPLSSQLQSAGSMILSLGRSRTNLFPNELTAFATDYGEAQALGYFQEQ